MTPDPDPADPESQRLTEDARREKNWKRWGPYLSERQWATVREDYSAEGSCWTYFPYEHSLLRAYRWGEDGLLGFTDRECRICLAFALWNHKDSHLKERLFGLTNPEGNHGEDVKEVYFYLDATPTSSYCKALYKYPQVAFPYEQLRAENKRRTRLDPEYELPETGAFDEDRYFDVCAEYAKAGPDDILVTLTVSNRGPDAAPITILPTVWFRNTWSWGVGYEEGEWTKPNLRAAGPGGVKLNHCSLPEYEFVARTQPEKWLFTENETNPTLFEGTLGTVARAAGLKSRGHYKDAFHHYVVDGDTRAVATDSGTKAAAVYEADIPAGGSVTYHFRLRSSSDAAPFEDFDTVHAERVAEADEFYAKRIPAHVQGRERLVSRQAYAGLLWGHQFYHWIVHEWRYGDRNHLNPPAVVEHRDNKGWSHLFSRDVLSTPDKWEYPAFFAWDTAFHMVALARVDPHLAKRQLLLFLREWYLHPDGQMPAYEYDLSNVDPPVHAWACWQVYVRDGKTDKTFLERVFHKLLMNFTWWVNRQDPQGRGVFAGGFLGMDNLGVFDRSKPLPIDGHLEQADGTAWMGSYCTVMLQIAIELALHDQSYEDVASKFFEHFVFIADSLNHLGGNGLWDEQDGFYYDQLLYNDESIPLRLRGMIGFVPLFAVLVLDEKLVKAKLPAFHKRAEWFLKYRKDALSYIGALDSRGEKPERHLLLTLTGNERLRRVLAYLLDEDEFLSPFGVRSLSRFYKDHPYRFEVGGKEFTVEYVSGPMHNGDFGGNSNWRGPVWVPMNFLIIDSLRLHHDFYGDDFTVECPTGSGTLMNLNEVADEIGKRIAALFFEQSECRPCPDLGVYAPFADDPHWKDCVMFHEYFDGDDGRGLGAMHQTGWTALVATLLGECDGGRGAK